MEYYIDEHEPKAEKALLHLYKNKQFTDVVVNCNSGNTKFYVHKLILSLFSPILSDRFSGKSDCNTLDFEDIALPAVENMLRFCYGEVPLFKNVYEIKETKVLAEKYEIKELLNICKKETGTIEVDISNVLTVLEMSMEDGNKCKETECLMVISLDHETVFTCKLFMKMKFERVCQIFDKLRDMGTLTEVQYLRSGLGWMSCDDAASKEIFMKKIGISKLSMEEFVDIVIYFPTFFTSTEIAKALQTIKSMQQTKLKTLETLIEQTVTSAPLVMRANVDSDKQGNEESHKKSNISISISNGVEGTKHAIVTIEEGITRRRLQFEIKGYLKDGIFNMLSNTHNDYHICNSIITYDGLFYMKNYIEERRTLSLWNYIEVLKTACCFGLQNLYDSLLDAYNIIDYDPTLLDDLKKFQHYQDLVIHFIIRNARNIIIHPNFINCSFETISMILSQPILNLFSELDLLIATLCWLEADNKFDCEHRFSLLNKIAFENIKYEDLVHVLKNYPNFFTDNEINSVLSYKMNGKLDNQESLPKWYNFNSRKLIQ